VCWLHVQKRQAAYELKPEIQVERRNFLWDGAEGGKKRGGSGKKEKEREREKEAISIDKKRKRGK
jgi:hypothetical protein